MDNRQFKEQMEDLQTAFRHKMSVDEQRLYYRSLQGYPVVTFEIAVRILVEDENRSAYFPRIGEIRKACSEAARQRADAERQALPAEDETPCPPERVKNYWLPLIREELAGARGPLAAGLARSLPRNDARSTPGSAPSAPEPPTPV